MTAALSSLFHLARPSVCCTLPRKAHWVQRGSHIFAKLTNGDATTWRRNLLVATIQRANHPLHAVGGRSGGRRFCHPTPRGPHQSETGTLLVRRCTSTHCRQAFRGASSAAPCVNLQGAQRHQQKQLSDGAPAPAAVAFASAPANERTDEACWRVCTCRRLMAPGLVRGDRLPVGAEFTFLNANGMLLSTGHITLQGGAYCCGTEASLSSGDWRTTKYRRQSTTTWRDTPGPAAAKGSGLPAAQPAAAVLAAASAEAQVNAAAAQKAKAAAEEAKAAAAAAAAAAAPAARAAALAAADGKVVAAVAAAAAAEAEAAAAAAVARAVLPAGRAPAAGAAAAPPLQQQHLGWVPNKPILRTRARLGGRLLSPEEARLHLAAAVARAAAATAKPAGLPRRPAKKTVRIQYHPEASPGPHDADICFEQFVEMMKAEALVKA